MGSSGPLQKLDLFLEGLAAFQEGAAALKAGDALALAPQEGGRLACVTRSGAVVGLVPADKRALLSRGPWSGTVRSVKKQHASAVAGASQPPAGQSTGQPSAAHSAEAQAGTSGLPGAAGGQKVASPQQQLAEGQPAQPSDPGSGEPGGQQQQRQQHEPAVAEAALQVVQLLVRFTPEEQRWLQRQPADALAGQQGEEDTARLSTEQYEALAASEEIQWMLRDERLQKVVADIDSAPDRERALVRALQAPNFKEFADKVLGVVAPEPS